MTVGLAPLATPTERAALEAAARTLGAGVGWREAFEALLLALPDRAAGELMQLVREGRGAFVPLLASRPGRALLVGDPLSGTAVALALAGHRVTVASDDASKLALALHRDRALARGDLEPVERPPGDPLPFRDGAFDLVVAEGGFAAGEPRPAELARVCREELVLVADNRLGYKRSTGVRAQFRVARPLEWAARALAPRDGERTLAGQRRTLARAGLPGASAFALYPHRHDFSHVVALDAERPALTVGPKERANRLKLAAWRAGAFPLFAPSFALVGRRGAAAPPRVRALLEAAAAALREPVPEVEHVVATRGNSAVLLTAVPGRDPADPAGRWVLHAPLSPHQREQAERHVARLRQVAVEFPELPAPAALWEGEVGGHFATVERRLPGWTLPQHAGDHRIAARVYARTAELLAGLVVRPAEPLDDAAFDALVAAKFELVLRRAAVADTIRNLSSLLVEARERLLGLPVPRVLYHADLRAKHVQVSGEGNVLGLLDWGSSESSDLPLFDLANLILHDRKQEAGLSAGEAWRLFASGGLRDFEERALADYCERLGLPDEYRRTLHAIHPVLVGAMAEKNWDYSRPRWLHRQFQV